MDLLRDVPLETEPLGNAERLRELPSREVRAADVPDLARVDERVERVERLLDRRLAVPLVHLVEVDVVDAESPKARLTSPNEVVTRESRFGKCSTCPIADSRPPSFSRLRWKNRSSSKERPGWARPRRQRRSPACSTPASSVCSATRGSTYRMRSTSGITRGSYCTSARRKRAASPKRSCSGHDS